MTVSTQVSRNEYTGNGATTQYDFTFRILDKSHLLVQTLDTSESIVTLTLGTDYTVTGVNRYNGGKVVLTSALPAGYKISIERSTPVTQEASIRNQGGFFPEIHEDAFDKLTMLVQQVYGWWSGLVLKKPSWLANYYDAMNNRIRNLRDPSQAQDAATKGYADAIDEKVNSNFRRTLRVPDSSITEMPTLPSLEGKVLGFANNRPVGVLPGTGSATDVMLQLAGIDGEKYIGTAESWSALKNITPSYEGQVITLQSYYKDWNAAGWIGPRGGKRFVAVRGSAVDDGGFICVPNGSAQWYWQALVSELNLFDFGVKVSDRKINRLLETSTELQNSINSAIKNKLPLVSSLYALRSGYADGQVLYIERGVELTGIKETRGIFAIIYKPSVIQRVYPRVDDDPTGVGYLIVNMNCEWGANGKIYGTSSGEQEMGCWTTYSLEGRNPAYPINGQLHCVSGSSFKLIADVHAYGSGPRFVDCYDSDFHDVRALFCGLVDQATGVEKLGVSFTSFTKPDSTSRTDESNSNRIGKVMAHNCHDLSWLVSGTKNNVQQVHEEATYVTTTWRNNPSSSLNNNGFGYYNSAFTSLGGCLGNADIAPASGNTIQHVHSAQGWGNDLASINCQSLGLLSGYSPVGGSVGVAVCSGNAFIRANARVSVSRLIVNGDLAVQDPNSAISGGNVRGNLTVSDGAKIDKFTVNGAVVITNGRPVFSGCSFNSTLTSNGGVAHFTGCDTAGNATFNGVVKYYGGTLRGAIDNRGASSIGGRAEILAGTFTSTSNDLIVNDVTMNADFSGGGSFDNIRGTGGYKTVSGLTLRLGPNVYSSGLLRLEGNDVQLYARAGRYDRISWDENVTGIWELFPCPTFNTSVTGWKLPTGNAGYGRMTVNPNTMKIFTLVGGTWAEYTTH